MLASKQHWFKKAPKSDRQATKAQKTGNYGDRLTQVTQLTNLEYLTLSEIPASLIFDMLGHFKNLRYLSLYSMPNNIGQLIHLEELRITQVVFKEIPEKISQLKKLKRVSLLCPENKWGEEKYEALKSWLPNDCQINVAFGNVY